MFDYPAAEPMPDPSAPSHWYQHEDNFRELVHFLSNSADIRGTAKSSVRQALYAGGGVMAGGVLLGPVGGLVGGIAGAIVGFLRADDYDGVMANLMKLEGAEKQKLLKHVGTILLAAGATAKQFESTDAFRASLIELANQPSVRGKVWDACKRVVTQHE